MKNIFKILLVCILFASCDETESVLFDGTTGVGFNEEIINVSVPEGGITIPVPVVSTTLSTEVRTFDAVAVPVDAETDLAASDYSLGTVTIPANSYEGTLNVTFNYDGLVDFQPYTLGVAIDVAGSAFPPITFNILKEFDITTYVCLDLKLNITADNYTSETTWEITDAGGNVVQSGGPYDDGTAGTVYSSSFSLTGGCYTFTIFDSYGDGLFDGVNEGNYDLFCAAQEVVSYASGGGNFGASESTDFCIVE